ncbi:unnamed protein product, partial [Hapterophycus canaliculatus]
SERHSIPPLEGILVSRVETEAGFRHGGVPDGIIRPSSAPGPGTSTAVEALSRSAPNSPKRVGAGGSKRGSLSTTVKNLLGTKDGLENLRASLQGDDKCNPDGAAGATAKAVAAVRAARANQGDPAGGGGRGRGAGVAMMMPEAVARAAGQGAAGAAAARLSGALRPSSAPSPATTAPVSKKASVFGGLVQTLVESNSMNWLSTGKLGSNRMPVEGGAGDSDDSTEDREPELEILLVDPQGLVRWVLPRLKERHFAVTVAHSAEEAMEMIHEGFFQVAVVDLHMPGMSGTDFCRQVRTHEVESTTATHSTGAGNHGGGGRGGGRDPGARAGGGGQSLPANGDDEESTPRLPATKLLLHTTSAGSVRLDELEAFLEEGLVEQYVPHPLDLSTLFDFLKLFEEDDDQYGTRKMSSLLANPENSNRGMFEPSSNRVGIVRDGSSSGAPIPRQAPGEAGFVARLLGVSREPPRPSVEDVASTFFEVKGRSREAHAA